MIGHQNTYAHLSLNSFSILQAWASQLGFPDSIVKLGMVNRSVKNSSSFIKPIMVIILSPILGNGKRSKNRRWAILICKGVGCNDVGMLAFGAWDFEQIDMPHLIPRIWPLIRRAVYMVWLGILRRWSAENWSGLVSWGTLVIECLWVSRGHSGTGRGPVSKSTCDTSGDATKLRVFRRWLDVLARAFSGTGFASASRFPESYYLSLAFMREIQLISISWSTYVLLSGLVCPGEVFAS